MKNISAIAFAANSSSFPFGISREKTVKILRDLADMISRGDLLTQSVRVTTLAQNDEYGVTGVRMILVEKHEQPAVKPSGPRDDFEQQTGG